MTIIRLLRLLNKNLNLLLLCSLALACVVFVFTRNLPQTFEAKTEIYTGIASGPSVEAIGSSRIDYMTTSNEFDNLIYIIKSEKTLGEVGEILLTKHLMMLSDEDIENTLSDDLIEFLQNTLPQAARDTLIVPGSETMTLRNIQKLHSNYIKSWTARNLFNNPTSPYSYSTLNQLSVRRISNSDLIVIHYSWRDPYVCKQTLEILNTVFAKELLEIKIGQSRALVTYFSDQVEEARMDLMTAEENLKNFRIENSVINYDQQTRNIAGMQSQLEAQYQEELRAKAAAESRVKQLESSLELNKKMLEFNDDLLEKRKRLVTLTTEIANLEVYAPNDTEQLQKLKDQARILEIELSNNLGQRFQYSKTKEGVNTRAIIQQWLEATLELDAIKARLSVLANRSNYVQDAYSQFSPLGSELGRLERAVGIAEKKYLELNHSLNMALTRQQSESISTGGIVVTVPPKLPATPIKSKEFLLILLAAVVGFIVPLALLVVIEFLDTTVRTPIRGEELTGLKLLGAYPDLTPKSEFKNVDMEWLKQKSIGHIVQNLRLEERKLKGMEKKYKTILLFSTRDNEGKDLIGNLIANELSILDKKVMLIRPSNKSEEHVVSTEYDEYSYRYDNSFLKVSSIDQFLPGEVQKENYDYVLVEIKGVIRDQYPIELIEKFDMAICIVSANRSWNKADRFALAEFMDTLQFEPRLVVNAVEPDFMDSVLGEIEKSRSTLRKLFKAMLTLQFKSNMRSKRKAKRVV